MRPAFVVTALTVLLLSGCSMRVSGTVTDHATGEPIGVCAIKIGPRTIKTDPLGQYKVNAERDWKTIEFLAPGYEPLKVPVDSSETRYPIVDVRLTRKRGAPIPGARFDPYTGRPLADTQAGPSASYQTPAADGANR